LHGLGPAEACRQHGITYEITGPDLATGTDRCAEVASRDRWNNRPFVLNVQGDEPFLDPADLETLCARFKAEVSTGHNMSDSRVPRMASLYFRCWDSARWKAQSTVKVVINRASQALYFSRSPIPCDRDRGDKQPEHGFLVHMGVYAFEKSALADFCRLPHGQLENLEKLEQLRALEAGWRILMCEASKESVGIDTPEDLEQARKKYANTGVND
jgi:3-deoxy-manno-octulosonate cytidylyltransferase (CMP-KDO synthetase)